MATPQERDTLSRWSSWGAIPQVFDDQNNEWSGERRRLRDLLSPQEWDAARRTTINAHYTDPDIATAMWDTLDALGFTEGRVIEPGAGSGVFIGTAPRGAAMTGVELDPLTAAITRGLYPHATIRTESYADTRVRTESWDAAIGNVPFADVTLLDPIHNTGRHTMHNHFIIKSLAGLHPGGVAAFITSAHTLDSASSAAREDMHDLADLLGAVRLPTGAHRRMAGTDSLTDVLIFRRREPGAPRTFDADWLRTTTVALEGEQRIRVNTHYAMNPERVLGDWTLGYGMYGAETLGVRGDLADVGGALRGQLDQIVAGARSAGLTYTPGDPDRPVDRRAETELWDGTIIKNGTEYAHAVNGYLEPFAVPKAHAVELDALLSLRDAASRLLEFESVEGPEGSRDLDQLRTDAASMYERYVDRYGPINRYTTRGTGRFSEPDPTNPDAEPEPILARVTPTAVRLLRGDPRGALVRALENFDDSTMTAAPATLLRQRVIVPRPEAQKPEGPEDAIALCLDRLGKLDLQEISTLLSVDPDVAMAMLGDLAYEDPATRELVHAPAYLAGNVGDKLEVAIEAASDDPRYDRNVEALRGVLPAAIPSDQITARMGAVWIDAPVYEQFMLEVLRDRAGKVEQGLPGRWTVTGNRHSVQATNEWGTDRRPAPDLMASVMSQSQIKVTDRIEGPDGTEREVLNAIETQAAQDKADALQARFAEWVWEDPARSAELSRVYNRRFNSIVLRDYGEVGAALTLPGLAENFTPRPHQRAAVARVLTEPTAGLFHEVGAGKTAEMVIAAMELRRMGLATKPVVVVPNHMLDQFSREWLQLYPQAKVLTASSEDLAGDKRRVFTARTAANDWDAVVMTQEAFKRIPVSDRFAADYIGEEVARLRSHLEKMNRTESAPSRRTVKQVEKRLLSLQEDIKKRLARPTDPGITWEETGLDYVFVDEGHMYKNLTTPSSISDASIQGSQKADDLHMKLEQLRRVKGDRVATIATATPIANSITEAYVMQRYLRPDLLDSAGITAFDQWAATFGQVETKMELGPAGGFRLKARFAKFTNVPELMAMWNVFADVKTQADLDLPRPEVTARASDGLRQAETVVVEPSQALREYMGTIAERARAVERRLVLPEEDNMLKISGDGRAAALDLRLVGAEAEPGSVTKLDAVAEKVIGIWTANKDNRYLVAETGDPSPYPGGLQLVFGDLGTPSGQGWNAYAELKQLLVERGMDPDRIRFIHEAKNDADKARIFAACRAGHVDVLMGSTAKMGVGTNVQARAVALHHIDCPWRPADVEQRDGRVIRQGNQNREVALYRYVVEGSFDGYNWQTVARKAAFIAQLTTGRGLEREVDDIGDTSLGAAEAAALGSGNPLMLRKAEADAEFQKLTRMHTAHARSQANLDALIRDSRSRVERCDAWIGLYQAAAQRSRPTAGDAFELTNGGATYTNRVEAQEAIGAWFAREGLEWVTPSSSKAEARPFATLGGHELSVEVVRGRIDVWQSKSYQVTIAGVPGVKNRYESASFAADHRGLLASLEHMVGGLPKLIGSLEQERFEAEKTITDGQARRGQEFPKAAELEVARKRVEDVNTAITEAAAAAKETENTPPATPTTPANTAGPVTGPAVPPPPALREAMRPPGSQFGGFTDPYAPPRPGGQHDAPDRGLGR